MVVVVVSHDRGFLNNVTEEIITLKDKQLKYHRGNYQDWEANTKEQRIRKQTLLYKGEKKYKMIQACIEHNLQITKVTGNDKCPGMVHYRFGLPLTARVQIEVEQGVKAAAIKIAESSQLRYNGLVFHMSDASFKYKKSTKNVINKFSINIEPNDRIAFVGPNGCGTSTLLDILTNEMQPTAGEVYRHTLLKKGYFSQHFMDQLDLDLLPADSMIKQYSTLSKHEYRAHFVTVGVSGKIALCKIRYLSGGQRNYTAFALILYERLHVWVLDEIANHLDTGTLEIHDVWFLMQILEPEADDSDSDVEEEPVQREAYTIK
ncbi:hypothetical protein PS15p_200724 [Mucor circinelloides]